MVAFTCYPILHTQFCGSNAQIASQISYPAEITVSAPDVEECIMADAKVESAPSSPLTSNSLDNDKEKCIIEAVCINELTSEVKRENYLHYSDSFTTLEVEYQLDIHQLSLSPADYSDLFSNYS